jgi:hypothetical protein
MNTFKRILLLIHLVMLDTCDRLWHEWFKTTKRKTHMCVSSRVSRHGHCSV